MRLFFLLLALTPLARPTPTAPTTLRVGSFNVQIFGVTKAGKPEVMDILSKVIRHYDVLMMQEIRDKSEDAIYDLLEMVNAGIPKEGQFVITMSERLGRSSSKEQYAYFYRPSSVQVLDTYTYDDADDDVFEREPYCILIEAKHNTMNGLPMRMGLIGVHVRPKDATAEIMALYSVYAEVKVKFQTENIVIMGDMNADCQYAKEKDLAKSDIFGDKDTFLSLFDGDTDTTLSGKSCAYDRMILTKTEIAEHEVGHKVEHFDEEYGLTYEEAKKVSDHYPVFVDFQL